MKELIEKLLDMAEKAQKRNDREAYAKIIKLITDVAYLKACEQFGVEY